jgi:hypothetical protein
VTPLCRFVSPSALFTLRSVHPPLCSPSALFTLRSPSALLTFRSVHPPLCSPSAHPPLYSPFALFTLRSPSALLTFRSAHPPLILSLNVAHFGSGSTQGALSESYCCPLLSAPILSVNFRRWGTSWILGSPFVALPFQYHLGSLLWLPSN